MKIGERINAAVWRFRYTFICQNKSVELDLLMLAEWIVLNQVFNNNSQGSQLRG